MAQHAVQQYEKVYLKNISLSTSPHPKLFLTEITAHLNELNLQGAGPTVSEMHDTCEAFVHKLTVFSSDFETSTFRHFKRAVRSAQYQHHGNARIHPRTRDRIRNVFSVLSAAWTTVFLSNQTRRLHCPAGSVTLQLAEYRRYENAAD